MEKSTLTFKGWNRPVCLLFGLPECLSIKICCISPSDSEANRDGSDAKSPFPLFFSLLRTLAREKRSENCLRFGTGGPSLCLNPLLSRNIIFARANNNGRLRKKRILARRFAHAISVSVHYRDFDHAYAYWIWLRDCATYVITKIKDVRTLITSAQTHTPLHESTAY